MRDDGPGPAVRLIHAERNRHVHNIATDTDSFAIRRAVRGQLPANRTPGDVVSAKVGEAASTDARTMAEAIIYPDRPW